MTIHVAPRLDLLADRELDLFHSRMAFWLYAAFLVATSTLGSWALTCATPFAAFAVIIAATLPLRSALVAMAMIWLANQTIGFGILGYPWSINSVLWGLAIGIAAQIATLSAAVTLRSFTNGGIVPAFTVGLAVSFTTYELCLLSASVLLGGQEAFEATIVGRLAILNAGWLAGLATAYEIFRFVTGYHGAHQQQ